jgi:hypothetical protein
MQHSLDEKSPTIVFHPQLLADFRTVEELGWKMLEELDRKPAVTVSVPMNASDAERFRRPKEPG